MEVGAGIGGMIERLLERVEIGQAEYVALDAEESHRAQAAQRLEAWAAEHGARWTAPADGAWEIERQRTHLRIHWLARSLFDDDTAEGPFDVLLAHAFLDLVDLDRALARLLPCLRPGGTCLFTLNFDGLTAFLPEIDPTLDRQIVEAYHATMDARRNDGLPSGSSRTGRRLLVELPRRGAEVLAAGASDWIIYPRAGGYAAGERTVLDAVVGFVEASLRASDFDDAALLSWVSRRRSQIEAGELVFLAHQIDILAQMATA